jgi:hypothetical protein
MGNRDLKTELFYAEETERAQRQQAVRKKRGFVDAPVHAESVARSFRETFLASGIDVDGVSPEQWSPLSLNIVLGRVAQAQDDAMMLDLTGPAHFMPRRKPHRESYQVRVEWDDPCEAYEHGCSWLSWGFGMRMSFLTALRVSGDLSVHFKECLAVRVALLEEQDGLELLKTKRRDGVTLYAPREVVVWRGGVVDPGWRPVPGRRARRLQRGL